MLYINLAYKRAYNAAHYYEPPSCEVGGPEN